MIREKDLQELRPQIRYKDGQDITLQSIQSALRDGAEQHDIDLAFAYDQVKSGMLGGCDDCLVLYHPEHQKDYFSIVIRVKYQGTYAFISADSFGTSKLMKTEALRKQVNAAAKEGMNDRGYNPFRRAMGGASMIAAGVMGARHLIKGKSDKEKMEIEQQWYLMVHDLIEETLS